MVWHLEVPKPVLVVHKCQLSHGLRGGCGLGQVRLVVIPSVGEGLGCRCRFVGAGKFPTRPSGTK
jgi:hypothetical protein